MAATTIRYKRQALGVVVGCTLFAIIILATAGSKSIIDASGVRLSGTSAKWPRVFCVINTMSTNVKRIIAVKETWAKHCDDYVFTMNNNPNNFEPAWNFNLGNAKHPANTRYWLWDKIRAIFQKINEEKLDQYDWFVKADDDSFYIIENLKQMLTQYDTEKPYFFGSKHWVDEPRRPKNITFASGGAGYVLSREAVRKFVSATRNPELCRQGSYFHEDTEVGQCMQNAGVEFITPLEGKKHSMLPISIFDLINDKDTDSRVRRLWAMRTSIPNIQKGWDCCSDRLISFHYVRPGQMRTIYYFIYKVKVAE